MKYYFFGSVLVMISFQNAISDSVKNTTSTRPSWLPTPNIRPINTGILDTFRNSHVKRIVEVFSKNNYQLRVAGGAVRDMLMGVRPKDLDFATDATPDQMKYFLHQEKILTINPNGEKHGTVTAHINGKNYEITTLRRDEECFGRHARVEFTENWQEDAIRRDLTVNCMFLDFNGMLYDYCGGEEDLKHRRVRFVGDAATRIREDYLRILRYFRFYGRVANESDNHDPETITAIRENKFGLSSISGERVWLELQQILTGRFNKEIVYKMFDVGLAPYFGLGNGSDLNKTRFEAVCELKKIRNYEFKPITYLAALLPTESKVHDLKSRLKLSNVERDLALFLLKEGSKPIVLIPEQPLRPYQSLLIEANHKDQVKDFIRELLRFQNVSENIFRSFVTWSIPRFPMETHRLRERGIAFGRQMGYVMKGLKRYWVNRNFNVTEDELLYQIPDLVAEFRKFLSPTIIWTNPATYTRWPLTNGTASSNTSTSTEFIPSLSSSNGKERSTSTEQSQVALTESLTLGRTENTSTEFPSSRHKETSTETTTQTEAATLSDDQKYKLNALDFLGGLQYTFRGF